MYHAPRQNEAKLDVGEDVALTESQLERLLKEGVFLEKNPPVEQPHQTAPVLRQPQPCDNQPLLSMPYQGADFTKEELEQLREAGVFLEGMQSPPRKQTFGASTPDHPLGNPSDTWQLRAEFESLPHNGRGRQQRPVSKSVVFHHFNVTQELPVMSNIYDKLPSRSCETFPVQPTGKTFSNYLVGVVYGY